MEALPMKVLIVVDSVYGNTEKIAGAIAGALTPSNEVKIVRPGNVNLQDLASCDLIIVGSPVQGGRSIKAVQDFLTKIPAGALNNKAVTAFDTRLKTAFVKLFGYAAGRIAGSLQEKGGKLIAPAEGFFVKGREGPLMDGEIERAASWAGGLVQAKTK
jgi:flavodoxin I